MNTLISIHSINLKTKTNTRFSVVSQSSSTITAGTYTIQKFTSSGSFVIKGNKTLYYVIVGGGSSPASTGGNFGSKGGAGGSVVSGINNNTGSVNTTYTINIGAGATASGLNSSGIDGSPSSIVYNSITITANGGKKDSTAGTTIKGLSGVTNVTETGASARGGAGANANCRGCCYSGENQYNANVQGYTVNIGNSAFIGNYAGGGAGGDTGNNQTNNAWGGGFPGTCNVGGPGWGTANSGGGAGGDHGSVASYGGSGIVLIFYLT